MVLTMTVPSLLLREGRTSLVQLFYHFTSSTQSERDRNSKIHEISCSTELKMKPKHTRIYRFARNYTWAQNDIGVKHISAPLITLTDSEASK